VPKPGRKIFKQSKTICQFFFVLTTCAPQKCECTFTSIKVFLLSLAIANNFLVVKTDLAPSFANSMLDEFSFNDAGKSVRF
jgi:hypothetical protein